MAQRLKRWESPRREGRNDKGRGGSARQRQRRKQFQMLRQKLKDQSQQNDQGGSGNASPLCFGDVLKVVKVNSFATGHPRQDRTVRQWFDHGNSFARTEAMPSYLSPFPIVGNNLAIKRQRR